MKNLQKAGGIAAVYAGAAYIVGIAGFLFLVGWPDDPVEQVAVLVNRQFSLHLLYLIVYQIWAVSLIILNLSLYEQMKSESPAIMGISSSIGIIWAALAVASGMISNIGIDNVVGLHGQNPAQATTAWLVIASVCDGIGGGNELLGGLWSLLICSAALRAGKFPRILNYIGLGAGVSGILSAMPLLDEAGLFFGLLQIVWFLWLGITMLRGSRN
ncbi:MAG: hypothetical protein B6D68_02920 [spirochete symbiont of Stewartia floridana]|nr:MAG: hypothetical protein B6D68_02920 [spirochete symbiont of Stewartia floridana]